MRVGRSVERLYESRRIASPCLKPPAPEAFMPNNSHLVEGLTLKAVMSGGRAREINARAGDRFTCRTEREASWTGRGRLKG